MKITYYGHSCFLIEVAGTKLLFDPFITPNPLAKDIDVYSIDADYILVSHGHEDHVADLELMAKSTGATILSNFEIVSYYEDKGHNGHPLNIGGVYQIDESLQIKYVNAVHSSVLPDGTYAGNPGGWVIESNEGNFYYSGDTALHYDMKLLGELFMLDFALLCIGDNFTMGIKDAIHAAKFVDVQRVIGMHYDTFEPISINHEESIQTFEASGIELTLMNINETITITK